KPPAEDKADKATTHCPPNSAPNAEFDGKNHPFLPPSDYTNQKIAGIMSAQAMSSARKGRGYAAPCLHEGAIPPSFSHRAKPVNEMERSGIECTAEFRKGKSR